MFMMRKQNLLIVLVILLQALCSASCSRMGNTPVTWENIANTIPANPDYVVSVNAEFKSDSIFTGFWGEDVNALIDKGLNLYSEKPSHIVVVSMSGTVFVTWPLPAPKAINKSITDWPTASLNNTVDARMTTQGNASLIISSTQAWVVNNAEGDESVNDLLSAAMNTKAVHVQPFANCMMDVPKAVCAVMPYNGRYYTIQLNHDDGQVRIDVDAYGKYNAPMELMDGLGRLPISTINEASDVQPFVAVDVDKGTLPKILEKIGSLTIPDVDLKDAEKLNSELAEVQGTLMLRWGKGMFSAEVPFGSHQLAQNALQAVRKIAGLVKDTLKVSHPEKIHLEKEPMRRDRFEEDSHYSDRDGGVAKEKNANKSSKKEFTLKVEGNNLLIHKESSDSLTRIDTDRKTPHFHTQTKNPSAIAFARLDIEKGLPVELYFELAPTHARLQIDYQESQPNFVEVLRFVKKLVFTIF